MLRGTMDRAPGGQAEVFWDVTESGDRSIDVTADLARGSRELGKLGGIGEVRSEHHDEVCDALDRECQVGHGDGFT